ncbi:MAG: AraC-like DNA-binding protein [Cyclobacteriaceae bacterium]
MKIQFSLIDLLILFGIIQGIITGILILNSKKNTRSKVFLALALFAFCFLSSKTLLLSLNIWEIPAFRYFPNGIELALPPLIYFYVKSLVNPRFTLKIRGWLHFIPFALSQTYAFVVYFAVLTTNNISEKDTIAGSLNFNYIKQIDEYLLLISLALYLFYGYRELHEYKKWLDNTTSNGTFPDFGWLNSIFRLSLIIAGFLLVNHSLDIFFDLNNTTYLHYNLLILFIAFLIYYLGLKGYLQPDYTFSKEEIILDSAPHATLSEAKITDTIDKLQKVMNDDKVFLNPKLSSYKLSMLLGVSQKNLSVAINQRYNVSFRDFINNYRLDEIKSKLNNADYHHMSIFGIALECGFNSEASFYRIFKKNIGISPKEFIQKKNTE